ncbi:hypothetical protein Tco_0184815, partial [Tanacetum coccineum]
IWCAVVGEVAIAALQSAIDGCIILPGGIGFWILNRSSFNHIYFLIEGIDAPSQLFIMPEKRELLSVKYEANGDGDSLMIILEGISDFLSQIPDVMRPKIRQWSNCRSRRVENEASPDSTDWNRAPSERRSDIWLDVKRRVVIEIAPKGVVEINTINRGAVTYEPLSIIAVGKDHLHIEDYVVKQQHGIRKQQAQEEGMIQAWENHEKRKAKTEMKEWSYLIILGTYWASALLHSIQDLQVVHKEVKFGLTCILTNRQWVESKAMLLLESR